MDWVDTECGNGSRRWTMLMKWMQVWAQVSKASSSPSYLYTLAEPCLLCPGSLITGPPIRCQATVCEPRQPLWPPLQRARWPRCYLPSKGSPAPVFGQTSASPRACGHACDRGMNGLGLFMASGTSRGVRDRTWTKGAEGRRCTRRGAPPPDFAGCRRSLNRRPRFCASPS